MGKASFILHHMYVAVTCITHISISASTTAFRSDDVGHGVVVTTQLHDPAAN